MTITDFFIRGFANNDIQITKEDIQQIIVSQSIDLNINKSIKDLSKEDNYHLGLIINNLYLNKKYFLSEIIALLDDHLNQIGQSISLEQLIPEINKIDYFNIFNLDTEGYNFLQKETTKDVLNNILDTFLINSKLKYNFKLKPKVDNFDGKYIRSTENLIVLYTHKSNSNKIFYYFFNNKMDTYNLLQGLSQNKFH